MTARQRMKRKRATVAVAAAGVLLWAGYGLFRHFYPPDERSGEKAFYTTDDGDHFFIDSADLNPPFPHDAKEAVRVWYFTCDDGRTRFVGYLEKFTDEAKAALERVKHDRRACQQALMEQLGLGARLVKRKGGEWIHWHEPEYQEVMTPICPEGADGGADGSPRIRRVLPGE